MKTKTWSHLPACTSAFRWLEHYYCFHGHNFTRFNPISGLVNGTYPKDARKYFMNCPNFGEFILASTSHSFQPLKTHSVIRCFIWLAGHGGGYKVPKCSEVKLDAITADEGGKMYAFVGKLVHLFALKATTLGITSQAFQSWMLQTFTVHRLPPQDPCTYALTLAGMVFMPSRSLGCGRRWLEMWTRYFPTATRCT